MVENLLQTNAQIIALQEVGNVLDKDATRTYNADYEFKKSHFFQILKKYGYEFRAKCRSVGQESAGGAAILFKKSLVVQDYEWDEAASSSICDTVSISVFINNNNNNNNDDAPTFLFTSFYLHASLEHNFDG